MTARKPRPIKAVKAWALMTEDESLVRHPTGPLAGLVWLFGSRKDAMYGAPSFCRPVRVEIRVVK